MKFIFTAVIIILAILAFFWWRDTQTEALRLSLDDNIQQISIPLNTKVLKLERGEYTYTLTRKEVINSEQYLVSLTNIFGKWKADREDPIDKYSSSFELYPYDEKHKKALEYQEIINRTGSFEMEVESDEEGRELMKIMNNLENEKINVAILPSNEMIKNKAERVDVDDVIEISGIHFDHSKVDRAGVEQQMSQCLTNVDLFYLTRLNIIN